MEVVSARPPRWNHNVHCHRVILAAVPDGARRSLDVGDFMTHPFAPGSFDHIASIAALHHMDAGAALARMGELLAPGGTLAVVGLARRVLPGVRYRRRLLWRYSLVWTKPAWLRAASRGAG